MLKTASSILNVIGALNYQGTWNANTNTPTLVSSVGSKGDYYVVSVAGTTNLNGITDWQIGDWAVFNGSVWQKVDNSDAVSSVNGQTGAVVLGANDVGATANTTYVLAGTGLSGGGQLNANVTVNLANTAVGAGTYGQTDSVGQFTVDAQGRITAASNVGIIVPVANVTGAVPNTVNVIAGTGLSGGGALTSNVTINLANTAVTANTYGSANVIPVITIDAQGRVTAATNTTVSIISSQISDSIPNSKLANSSLTLGNATLTLGGTTSTVGNLTLTNATISSGSVTTATLNLTGTTAANATFATSSLPLVPEGYITVQIGGVNKKIPYYGV